MSNLIRVDCEFSK